MGLFSKPFDQFVRNLGFGVLMARPQSPGGQISGYIWFRPEVDKNLMAETGVTTGFSFLANLTTFGIEP